MTDTTNPNSEQARRVLAAAIRRQGDRAASADGILAGRDHAVWANVAIAAMLEFATLPTPEAERVEIPAGMKLLPVKPTTAMEDAGWQALNDEPDGSLTPDAVEAVWSAMLAAYTPRPSNDPAAGSAGENGRVERLRRKAHDLAARALEMTQLRLADEIYALAALHPTQDSRDVAGAEAMREACAKVAEAEGTAPWEDPQTTKRNIAAAIRALPLPSTAPGEASHGAGSGEQA